MTVKDRTSIDLDEIFVIFDEYIEILEGDGDKEGEIDQIEKVKRDLTCLFTSVSETQSSLKDLDNFTLWY